MLAFEPPYKEKGAQKTMKEVARRKEAANDGSKA